MISIEVHQAGRSLAREILYLPGLHGDSTLVGGFREATRGLGRFHAVGYRRDGSGDPARLGGAVAEAFAGGIGLPVWIVAESFGSLVGWELLRRRPEWPDGSRLVLAGGFVRHPWPTGVALTRRIGTATPGRLRSFLVDLHRWTLGSLGEPTPGREAAWIRFREERCHPEDAAAMARRLSGILTTDCRDVAVATRIPVHQVSGFWDPIVPWWSVRDELRAGCPGYRGTRILGRSDHAVLVMRPTAVADWMASWRD